MKSLGRGYLICILASLLVAYQFMVQITPGLMVHQMASGLNISLTQVGFLSSAMFYSYLLLQGPCGAITQKLGPRLSLLIAALGIPLSCLVVAYSDGYAMAVVGRLLAGIFAAPCVVSCFVLGNRWLPEHLFPSLCGIVEMMGMAGAAIGPIIIAGSLEKYGWQSTYLLVAVLGLFLLLLVFFLVKDPSMNKRASITTFVPSTVEDQKKYKGMAGLKLLIRTPGYLACCLFGFFTFAVLNSFGGLWLIPFAKTLYNLSDITVGLLITFIFAGAACGLFMVGILATSISTRKLMIGGTVSCLLLIALILFIPMSFITMLGFSFLLGVSSGVYLIPFAVIRHKVPKELSGLALGIANGIIIASGLVFQPLIGGLLSLQCFNNEAINTWNYQLAFLPLLAGLFIALGLALNTKEAVATKKKLVIAT